MNKLKEILFVVVMLNAIAGVMALETIVGESPSNNAEVAQVEGVSLSTLELEPSSLLRK